MPTRIPYSRPTRLGARPTTLAESKAERARFYAGRAWQLTRAAVLAESPLCEPCLREGRETAATLVHHKEERLLAPGLALDRGNLESSCNPCHTRLHKRREH